MIPFRPKKVGFEIRQTNKSGAKINLAIFIDFQYPHDEKLPGAGETGNPLFCMPLKNKRELIIRTVARKAAIL